MPKPIPVYMVERPTFGGQLIMFMLIVGFAAAALKFAIVAALCCGAAWVALRLMLVRPGLSFFTLFWMGGMYVLSGIVPLMILWAILSPAAISWLIYVNTDRALRPAVPAALLNHKPS